MNGLVVFTDDNAHWGAPALKRGYRHVFCVIPELHMPNASLVIDLTLNGLQVQAVQGSPQDLVGFYKKQGLEAWQVPYTPDDRHLMPLMLNNCVGMTKQVMGLRSRAITPYQMRQEFARCDLILQSQGLGTVTNAPLLQPHQHRLRRLPKWMQRALSR